MLKKDGWQKKFLRVKQMADQNLGRAEKSEVLSEDLLLLEKRVDLIKQVCHSTQKSMTACIQGKGNDVEKRLKKMPESVLGHSMIESGQLLGTDTLMGKMYQICGEAEGSIAADLLQCEMEVEGRVLVPLQTIDNEINNIHRSRKHLTKSVLDMDSARSRYQSAVKQAQGSGGTKVENIRDEMEEASQRVEQCRDQISTDIYTFVSKETEHCQLLVDLINAQFCYHRRALDVLEGIIPQLQEQIESSSATPVFGGPLEDHLNRVKRDISVVMEECICTLLMYGMSEEGLFRIAGSASKVKKLRAAFDSGMVDMREFDSDIHAVAGALKMYLRELPDPLMTTELYQEWMAAANLPVEQRLQALWMVLDKLPKHNYNNLRYLIKFLAKLAENQDVNKMSPSNIAIVMGPNLMWAPGDGGPSMLSTSMQSAIVEIFISHANWFFPEDVDFGVAPPSISPAHSGSNSSLLDNNQNINHDSATHTSSRMMGAFAEALGPAMVLQTAVNVNTTAPVSTVGGQHTTPPSSMTASTNSLNSSEERPQPISPKLSKRPTKKAPAPLPPGVPERPPVPAEKQVTDAPHVTVSAPGEASNRPPIPERPLVPPPIPPAPSDKLYPSLSTVADQKPEKPDKPTSPRPDRPKAPPPDRPHFPPPEKPEKPPLPASFEKSQLPGRPELPKPELPPSSGGTLSRQERLSSGSGRPPRPQPPPPPPPDRRTSQENRAPIAEPEPVSPSDTPKNASNASTYL